MAETDYCQLAIDLAHARVRLTRKEKVTALRTLLEAFGGTIWNLGQLTPPQERLLRWGAAEGLLEQSRACWPWGHIGTCVKTRWVAQEALWQD